MRIEANIDRCSDDPSLCKGYLECFRDDGKTFTMSTGRFKTNERALKELQDVLMKAVKNIKFNLKQIESHKK